MTVYSLTELLLACAGWSAVALMVGGSLGYSVGRYVRERSPVALAPAVGFVDGRTGQIRVVRIDRAINSYRGGQA